MKISVIIPFFNVSEEMFNACLKSILQQTCDDFELIIVNDGSDNVFKQMLDRLSVKDKRIKVFHKENGGVSSARNYGVEQAKGENIVFVDADDQIVPSFFEEALQIQNETGADMVIGGNVEAGSSIIPDKRKLNYEVFRDEKCKSLKQYFVGGSLLRFENGGYFGRGPWSRLIKADIARQMKFDVNLRQGEDIVWNLQLLNSTNCVCLAKHIWYIYTINSNSATHKYNPNITREITSEMFQIKQQLDLDDDKEYCAYCGKLLDELKKSAICYYNKGKDRLNEKNERQDIYRSEPWKQIKSNRYFRLADNKYKFLAFLYKYQMLFAFYKLWYR